VNRSCFDPNSISATDATSTAADRTQADTGAARSANSPGYPDRYATVGWDGVASSSASACRSDESGR